MLGRAHIWTKQLKFTATFTISYHKISYQRRIWSQEIFSRHFWIVKPSSVNKCLCVLALILHSFTSKEMLSLWPTFHLQTIEFVELSARLSTGFDMDWLRPETRGGKSSALCSLGRALVFIPTGASTCKALPLWLPTLRSVIILVNYI